jgi:diacylglycerol kinase (ATP)
LSLVIIINPVSGGGRDRARERAERAAAALEALGRPGEVVVTERRGHARELATAAVGRGAPLVMAWGGDGTMNEVASALVHTPTAMGLIPCGSGNGLARTLGVSRDPGQAIADACEAAPRLMDGGQCNGEWFFSVAGAGIDARVAACFDRGVGRRRGFSTYVRVTTRELLTYVPRRYRIDGVWTERPVLLLTAANAREFGNGALIAPQASVDDGLLDLVVVEERSRLASILALPRLFNGSINRVRSVSIRRIARTEIQCDGPLIYHLDGEPRGEADRLSLVVHPGVLRIRVR